MFYVLHKVGFVKIFLNIDIVRRETHIIKISPISNNILYPCRSAL